MISQKASLLDELESAIQNGSSERRLETLRRVTDLFLGGADKFNDDQIGVFDQVLGHLISKIETKALAELSLRLAPINCAPVDTIGRLARNDEISVAGPVLTTSSRLSTDDLVEIAQTKGQAHLLAISDRPMLLPSVTDVLLTRGDSAVLHRVAENVSSKLSPKGFAILANAAERDDSLAEKTASRIDIPTHVLRELLLKASEAVRLRLMSSLPDGVVREVEKTLEMAVSAVKQEVVQPRDYAAAQKFVELLSQKNELREADLLRFARSKQYEETVAALSLLAGAPIAILKPLMQSPRLDGLLIVCRSADFKWDTVRSIIELRFSNSISPVEIDRIGTEFAKLSKASAQRTLRFWKIREASQGVTH